MPASWTSRESVLIRLSRQHFAFYRGYLDGLDVRMLAERYLVGETIAAGKESGKSSGKALLGWIMQQLVVEAERCGQRSAARLLRLLPIQNQVPKQLATLPTLAEFQEERDPYHMYSEEELLELFALEYPARAGNADRFAQRNRRLRRRQEALLQLIESQIRLDPKLDDPVIAWIDPGLARYLVKAGIVTLADLHARIEAYGFHWYRKVPRIGIKAARHITSWLLLPTTKQALGVTLSTRGTTPPRQIKSERMTPIEKGLGIVPLERLSLPDCLSGLTGTNRGAVASIGAANDIEAIQAWLLEMKPGSHTARACRKEAERFLLWCALEAGKPLSSVGATDVQAYLHFLAHLGKQPPEAWAQQHRTPPEIWLGPRGVDRWSVRWRPFEGPLSIASQRAALSLLKNLMRYLSATGYLQLDPCKGLRGPVAPGGDSAGGKLPRRSVLEDEWAAAWAYLQRQPESAHSRRIKVILLLLKETGCRLQQLASVRRDALVWNNNQLCLKLSGEGAGDRVYTLSEELCKALLGIYRFHGFDELDSVPSSAPIITFMPLDMGIRAEVSGLSSARIYRIVKDFFEDVAVDVSLDNSGLAERLRRFSANSFLHRK